MKSGLSILVDEKAVNDILKQKTGARAFLRSACNVVLFLVFLLLYTGLALSEPLQVQRAFEGFLRRRFDSGARMQIHEVDSIHKFWRYTNESFVPGLYGNSTAFYLYPEHITAVFLPIGPGVELNEPTPARLFGAGARLKQVKITPGDGCIVAPEFSANFPDCYGPYNAEMVDKEAYGPDHPLGGKTYNYNEESAGFETGGKLATYAPGGFMEALTADYNNSVRMLAKLEADMWIGESTRAIFYDFTIYNFNLALYAVCRISFEIAPSGAWLNSFDVDILRQRHINPLGTATNAELFLLLGEALLIILVIWYLLEEASEIFGCDKRQGPNGEKRIPPYKPKIKFGYFLDTWNLLDWANLVLMIITFVMRINTWTIAANVEIYDGDPAGAGVGTFSDFSAVAQSVRLVRSLTAFNAVLTWFKTIKYIDVIPYVTTFMQTVTQSQGLLVPWVILSTSTLFGFMLAYSSAFQSMFRSLFDSFNFLIRSLCGNSDFSPIYHKSPLLGSLIMLLFILGMYFILLNIFNAIMLSALADVRQAQGVLQKKKMEKNMEKFNDLVSSVRSSFRLDQRFRLAFPGLYSRLNNRKKKLELKEKAREEWVLSKELAKDAEERSNLGPGDPSQGRRRKRAIASAFTDGVDEESDDEGSEPDLGPLYRREQLMPGGALDDDDFVEEDGDGGPPAGAPKPPQERHPWDKEGPLEELGDEAIDLVIDATRHVSDGVVERTRGARRILFSEMTESKEVLQGIGSVLEVLGRRVRDLEAQQMQLLGLSY